MGERAEYERRRQEELAKFRPWREVQAELILRAAELCHRNRDEMSRVLGIPRTTLFRRIKQLKNEGRYA